MISAFHGIGAYRGQKNPVALSKQLTQCLQIDGEICVSEKPIGAFGAVFGGDVTFLFDRDVWSYVGENGVRYTDQYSDQHNYINPTSQYNFEDFCKKSSNKYCEGFMVTQCLRAIWVKEWADEKTIKAAMIIAKNRRVPFIVVKGTTRIWDVLDFYNLPIAV